MKFYFGKQHRLGRMPNAEFINRVYGYRRWLCAGEIDGVRQYWRHSPTGQQIIVGDNELRLNAQLLRPHYARIIRLRRLRRRMRYICSLKAHVTPSIHTGYGPEIARCSVHDPLYKMFGREYNIIRGRIKRLSKELGAARMMAFA